MLGNMWMWGRGGRVSDSQICAPPDYLGRADFRVQVRVLRRGLLDNGYTTEIAITSEHALDVENLPLIHKDPFDRILVAQPNVEGITLLTSDELVAKFPGPVRYV
jgi:PIN domain nuclease of toxin-antitoxin system